MLAKKTNFPLAHLKKAINCRVGVSCETGRMGRIRKVFLNALSYWSYLFYYHSTGPSTKRASQRASEATLPLTRGIGFLRHFRIKTRSAPFAAKNNERGSRRGKSTAKMTGLKTASAVHSLPGVLSKQSHHIIMQRPAPVNGKKTDRTDPQKSKYPRRPFGFRGRLKTLKWKGIGRGKEVWSVKRSE